ncbi:hypothetical protein [Rheinheimera sp.]|uniref:hypothetical protein n=1 Tax=Rheinheimera sp. TaxID=1869214 RepID=UPI00307F782D
MKAKITGLLVLAVALILGGCSSSANYAYQIDQQQLEKQQNSTRLSAHTGHVVWMNPPLKKVEKVQTN